MLLREFQEVTELDGQIINLQNALVDLYRKRAAFVGEETAKPAAKASKKTDWTTEQYDYLAQAWAVYGIKAPAFSSLKTKLAKAEKLITELSLADPRLTGYLTVVLVPPTTMVTPQKLSTMRGQQRFIKQDDFASSDITKPASASTWNVLLAYTAPNGLELGTAQEILKNKSYKIAGHDMRGLGVREYLAMTLQLQKPVDTNGWTILLKGAGKGMVPSASFMNGQYRFDVDDVSGLAEQDRFRPGLTIKGGK